MEKKFLKYLLLLIIFFTGLSLGLNFTNRPQQVQDDLTDFEDDITNPNNDYDDDEDGFTPVNPSKNGNKGKGNTEYVGNDIDSNAFTSLAKDGEYIIKKGIEVVFEATGSFFRMIFQQNNNS